jgi:hypothetical protein
MVRRVVPPLPVLMVLAEELKRAGRRREGFPKDEVIGAARVPSGRAATSEDGWAQSAGYRAV